jgi:hypothetical protein
MTETPEPAPASQGATPPEDQGSFVGNLFNLYFEPAPTFTKIFKRPRVVLAILLQVAMGVIFTTIWLDRMNPREFMKAQMEQNPRIQEMPAEQVEQIIDAQAGYMRTWGRVGPWIAPLVIDLLVAGILLFMFRFFFAVDVSFLQSLTTVAWTFAALGLIQTPIMLAVFALKGDWNLDPNQIIQANPTVFFEAGDLPRWLASLLSSFDLFSLWTVFLLAQGFAAAGKRELSTGLMGVCIPWALYVMAKVAFALMFG